MGVLCLIIDQKTHWNVLQTIKMSTRGWVTVNVFWLVNKAPKDDYLGPHIGRDQLELCPLASGILSKHERDVIPASVHVSYTHVILQCLHICHSHENDSKTLLLNKQ